MATSPSTLPGTLPGLNSTGTEPPPPAYLDPRIAALAAVERRAQIIPDNQASTSASSHSASEIFNPSAADKLPFHRLLDSSLLPNCGKTQAVKTIETLVTLTSNILSPPNPAQAAKYRQLRLQNSMIHKNIVEIDGAFDYIIACGFRKSIVEFVPYLTFSSSPSPKLLHTLKTGHYVLTQVMEKAKAAEDRESRFKESEKDAEKARVGKVMQGFEEDRRLKKEKDDRDKIVRDSKAQKARDLVAATAQAALQHNQDAGNPLLRGPSDASTMEIDDDLEEGPPSYGALHGRVLGTGAAVTFPGARLVSAQDEEESEEEEEDDDE